MSTLTIFLFYILLIKHEKVNLKASSKIFIILFIFHFWPVTLLQFTNKSSQMLCIQRELFFSLIMANVETKYVYSVSPNMEHPVVYQKEISQKMVSTPLDIILYLLMNINDNHKKMCNTHAENC